MLPSPLYLMVYTSHSFESPMWMSVLWLVIIAVLYTFRSYGVGEMKTNERTKKKRHETDGYVILLPLFYGTWRMVCVDGWKRGWAPIVYAWMYTMKGNTAIWLLLRCCCGTTTSAAAMMMMSINAVCNECFSTLNTEECISFTARERRLLYGPMAISCIQTIRSLCRFRWRDTDARLSGTRFGFCVCATVKYTRKTRAITLHNKNKSYWLFFFCARRLTGSFVVDGGVSCLFRRFCVWSVYGWPNAGTLQYTFLLFVRRFIFCFWFFRGCLCCCVGRCLHTMNTRLLIRNNKNYEWNVWKLSVEWCEHTFNLA